MSNSAVSFEDVRNAFFAILGEGGNPTFDSIYNRIGRKGGADVVRRLITQVKAEAAQLHDKLTLSHIPGVPEPLVDLMNEFTRTSWDLALDSAMKNLELARETLALEKAELTTANEALRTTADELAQNVLLLQTQIAGVERACTERDDRIRTLTDEIEHLNERNEGLHGQVAHYQRRIGELESNVQAERKRGERALEVASERHEAALSALTERNQQLVMELRSEFDRQMALAEARADADRKHLMKQTDELRQDFIRKEQALKKATDSAQMSEKKAHEQLRTNNKTIASLREQLAEAHGRISALSGIAAIIQTQLALEGKTEEGAPENGT